MFFVLFTLFFLPQRAWGDPRLQPVKCTCGASSNNFATCAVDRATVWLSMLWELFLTSVFPCHFSEVATSLLWGFHFEFCPIQSCFFLAQAQQVIESLWAHPFPPVERPLFENLRILSWIKMPGFYWHVCVFCTQVPNPNPGGTAGRGLERWEKCTYIL